MDRRDFLTLKKNSGHSAPVSADNVRGIQSGLTPYSGPWTNNEIAHLLKRTMFGAARADIDYFRGLTMSQAVDELLNTLGSLPPPPLKNYDNSDIPATDPDYGIAQWTTWVNTVSDDGTVNFHRRQSLCRPVRPQCCWHR